ncbi:peroxidasin-like isoform X2 [Ptychodera flava]|uniref:peroxidasin-like isoform X2 n=1 Tax=Ptychodera flava TaxID=63121 RepID=UPI00396A3991
MTSLWSRAFMWFAFGAVYCPATGPADLSFPCTGDEVLDLSIQDAITTVDKAILETTRTIWENHEPRNPNDLLRLFRFPSKDIVEVARAQEIFEAILEKIKDRNAEGIQMRSRRQTADEKDMAFERIVKPDLLVDIPVISGCNGLNNPIQCENLCFHARYRTFDGTCNNLDKPHQGAALRPFARLLRPVYEDGFTEPVGWNNGRLYNGFEKPSPRLVSTTMGSTSNITDHGKLTDLVSLWGQFLDHDLSLTPTSPSSMSFKDGVKCSESCDNRHPCFPISIPENDTRIKTQCMEFTRSSAFCGFSPFSNHSEEVVPREQMNAITSYIDGSLVYGSSESMAGRLRAFDGKGGMKVSKINQNGSFPLLPFDKDARMVCESDGKNPTIPCFLTGDTRANELTGLTSLHTLFIREHNRLAGLLSDLNPDWDDETIYQEARKIVGAQIQHISYYDYMPKILDEASVRELQSQTTYKPEVDASIFNVFATAAYRFGHATVKPILRRLGPDFKPIEQGNLRLHEAFFQPWRIVQEGGIDPILRGFVSTAAKDLTPDEIMTDELTEHLFELSNTVALDLMSLNIQRGRDHGLAGYSEWREFCQLGSAESFGDLAGNISNEAVLGKLRDLYGHPGNIDLFVGALSEDPLPGGIVGPTFTCLLLKQFKALKEGDRFWYENEGVFTNGQVAELKKVTLARIICDNTDISEVQADVFTMPGNDSELLNCSAIEGIDLTPWTYHKEGI